MAPAPRVARELAADKLPGCHLSRIDILKLMAAAKISATIVCENAARSIHENNKEPEKFRVHRNFLMLKGPGALPQLVTHFFW
jgi:hypothetical protein